MLDFPSRPRASSFTFAFIIDIHIHIEQRVRVRVHIRVLILVLLSSSSSSLLPLPLPPISRHTSQRKTFAFFFHIFFTVFRFSSGRAKLLQGAFCCILHFWARAATRGNGSAVAEYVDAVSDVATSLRNCRRQQQQQQPSQPPSSSSSQKHKQPSTSSSASSSSNRSKCSGLYKAKDKKRKTIYSASRSPNTLRSVVKFIFLISQQI